MPTSNSVNSLPIPSPDFTPIKESLKVFLKSQDTLKDYDFDGAALNVILDLLSYNTHLNSFWLNMVANEQYLVSAIKRQNIISNAAKLGYRPTSAKSAFCDIVVTFNPEPTITEDVVLIPAGTTFLSSTNSSSYVFNTMRDYVATKDPVTGKYVSETMRIYEGRLLIHEYRVVTQKQFGEIDTTDDVTLTGVSVPNLNVDTSLLSVYVDDSTDNISDFEEYTLYEKDSLAISKDSRYYFLSEDEFGYPKITFGDGVLGKKPAVGSIIKVAYIISSGPGANNVGVFNQATRIENMTVESIIPLFPAAGGAWSESNDSIKYNAKLFYEAQGRAVTLNDYQHFAKQAYPNYANMNVWPGEDNIPPVFGKVFISIQPKRGLFVSDYDKKEIKKYIQSKNILTIKPEVVDPDYLSLDLVVNVKWQGSNGTINQDVTAAIENYFKEKSTFNSHIEYSRLTAAIDQSNKNIISNSVSYILKRQFNQLSNSSLPFYNAIVPGSLASEEFTFNNFSKCKIVDDSGIIKIISFFEGQNVTVDPDIGTINYETGLIIIDSSKLSIRQLSVVLYAKPALQNIKSDRNCIINISDVKINQSRQ